MAKTYNFGEQKVEKIKGKEMKVFLSPKYESSKEAAIKLLESDAGKTLTTNDFWIQKNQSKNGEWLIYSALIITHDALMKINATLSEDKRFDQRFCSDPVPFEYGGKKGLYMTYRDERDGMFEIGEITTDSCKNDYPFAMLLKRTFDRVVKRKANLFGIYSDAEDFSPVEEDEDIKPSTTRGSGRRPATTSIPKEEDEELNADPETGEIIEKPEEKAGVKMQPLSEEEKKEIDSALNHVLEGLTKRDGQGFGLRKLVESEKLSPEQKRQRLQLFQSKGSESDKTACSVILAAVDSGYVSLEEHPF